jgi:hypothetical protein
LLFCTATTLFDFSFTLFDDWWLLLVIGGINFLELIWHLLLRYLFWLLSAFAASNNALLSFAIFIFLVFLHPQMPINPSQWHIFRIIVLYNI